MDWTRARREARQRLADTRTRLTAAERALAQARAALGRAERQFGAADQRVSKAEAALEDARARRDKARRERYSARQAHDRASLAVARLQRRVREVSARLDRMPPLAVAQAGREPAAGIALACGGGSRDHARIRHGTRGVPRALGRVTGRHGAAGRSGHGQPRRTARRAGLAHPGGAHHGGGGYTRTTFCDSASVAALVRAAQQASSAGIRLRLAGSGPVLRVLRLLEADRIIDVHPSLTAALGEVLPGAELGSGAVCGQPAEVSPPDESGQATFPR